MRYLEYVTMKRLNKEYNISIKLLEKKNCEMKNVETCKKITYATQ